MLNIKKFNKTGKLSIGTAQFGLNYGINNKLGKIKLIEAKKIIEFARKKKIKYIDTAYQYGDAEKILGKIGVKDFKVTSKIPLIKKNKLNEIEYYIKKTLKNLNIKYLECALIHDKKNIKKNIGEIYKKLNYLKKKKIVKKIGVSLVDFDDIFKIVKKYNFDIIQITYNILDQRLDNKKLINILKKKKTQIQIRSIFLQGILFKDYEFLVQKFKNTNFDWEKTKFFFKKKLEERLEYMVNFAFQNKVAKNIIVGIDSLTQLKKILDVKKIKLTNKKNLLCNNDQIINPFLWRK